MTGGRFRSRNREVEMALIAVLSGWARHVDLV